MPGEAVFFTAHGRLKKQEVSPAAEGTGAFLLWTNLNVMQLVIDSCYIYLHFYNSSFSHLFVFLNSVGITTTYSTKRSP